MTNQSYVRQRGPAASAEGESVVDLRSDSQDDASNLNDDTTILPWFLAESLHQKYMNYRRQIHGYSDFASQFPTAIVALVQILTVDGKNQSSQSLSVHLLLWGSFTLLMVSALVHLIYSSARLALDRKWYSGNNDKDRQIRVILRYIAREMLWGRVDDMCLTACTMSNVIRLLGSCIQLGRSIPALPAELTVQLFLLYASIFANQQFKVVAFNVIAVNWFVAVIAFIFTSSYYAGVGPSYATMFACHVFVFTSFEYERKWRMSYLRFRKIAHRRAMNYLQAELQDREM